MPGKMDTQQDQERGLRVVVLANQPRNLRHMLHRALTVIPRTPVVIELDNPEMIPDVLDRVPVDWLVATLTAEGELTAPAEEAVDEHPSLGVIGISTDGSHIAVQGPQRDNDNGARTQDSFDEISLSDLILILQDHND